MTLWILRGGRAGEREKRMVEEGLLSVGWQELPDLSAYDTVESVAASYRSTYPESRETRVASHAAQIHDFVKAASSGDLVVMPLSSRPAAALGEITGEYAHRTDLGQGMSHTRPVRWLRRAIPKDLLENEVLEAFDGFMTFSRVPGERAAENLRRIAEDPSVPELPAPAHGPVPSSRPQRSPRGGDLSRQARDQILDAIGRKFRGGDFVRLVRSVLTAHGLVTGPVESHRSGHVDFLAGGGVLGFGPPRTLVRISSSGRPAPPDAVGELMDDLATVGATEALLVGWGGYRGRESGEHGHESFFQVRVWDPDQLLDVFLEVYEQLPEEIRSQIPLRKIWILSDRRSPPFS